MPTNGCEAWQQARAAARPPPQQYPASSAASAAGSNAEGDGDADAAILAQIRALQARLSSSSSEHVAANTVAPQRRLNSRPPAASGASSSSSTSRTSNSILAPASPSRASASAPGPSSASSSASSPYRGPQYMSSRAQSGVQELVRQAQAAPRAPKPRPQWFLKHAQQRQEEAAQQKDIASSSTGLTRDDRLALMENMDLKPGPIDFGRGMHNDYEPYSGQRLRGGRLISHEDFNEIMTGRYFLSPSQLYSIRVPAIGRKKGADGDFDVPVPGDFVIVVTITNASDTIVPKEDEEDKMQESNARLVDEEEWLGSMGRSNASSSSSSAPGRGFQINSLDHRKPPKGPLRWFDLQDLSSRPVDGQSEGRGDCMLKLMVKKASHRDKETGEYSGGSRGAFEKLEAERSGGAVIAIINPLLLGDKKKGRPRKDGTEPTDVNASNSVMTIMARDAESLFIIGRCKDYASCTALKADGQKCKQFVDRRTSTCRGPALCDYHLDNGAQRAHKGRQELANTTSSFFGGGGSIGYGGRGEDGEGRKKQTSGWAAWRAKKEGRGGRGGGYSSSGRPWEPRPPRTGDLTYGLEGGAISRQQFVVADSAQANLSHNDPQSQRFSVRDAYGREKEERELRKRKREEEGRVLRELERKRAGYVGLEGSQVRRDGGEEASQGGGAGEEAVPFTLPSHSTGALAIADAQKTLQERKEKAAKAAAAKAAAASSSRKKSKTAAAASTATSRNNALRLDDSGDDDDSNPPSASQDPLTQSLSSSQQQPSRWRHSASAIKLMGFDPLSDSRSRQNRNGSTGNGTGGTDLVTSSLLRRHAASNAELPEARLSLKRGEKRRSGVRAPPGQSGGEERREGGGAAGQQQVVEISDDDDGDDDALEIV